jgi:lactose/L-arabinose transport system ATP-binding protein
VIVETKGEDAPVSDGLVAIDFDPASALFFDAKTEQRLR